jgi:hypothetical protein
MEEKAKALKAWLQNAFPDSGIDYQFPLTLHKFRITTKRATYWLYVSREFVDDNQVGHIIQTAERAKILEAFHASSKSRWIFLASTGVQEVDENFGKNA